MNSDNFTEIEFDSQTTTSTSPSWFIRVLLWREKNIPERTFVAMLALVVGLVAGFAALLLKSLIGFFSSFLTSHMNVATGNIGYLIFPIVGILISAIYVHYIVRDDISHGVTRVLYAIAQKKSRLKPHNMYASVFASSITIGFGGSVGAEGPIVFTGASIGSNLGRLFRLSPRILMMLVGCGAAAGIAGIFKAPIAGVLFTFEVLMLDLTASSVIPLLIASVAGATVSYIFTGYNVEFIFSQSEMFYTERIPLAIMLGLFCGLISIYFNFTIGKMEHMFRVIKKPWVKFVIGATILSLLIFLLPPLYGEGYKSINCLLSGNVAELFDGSPFYAFRHNPWACISFVAMLCMMKVFATSATNGAGGVGGTFAPTLYVGCMAGFLFAYTLNSLGLTDATLSVKNFALMGMAGCMAGVMHAPLMAIFLTAEMTGGYELFLPLLIVATVSYATSRLVTPYGIYSRRLARRGELLTHEKDLSVLTLLKMDSVIETDFVTVKPDMNLKQMVDAISQSHRNLFPVTDDNGTLLGVVNLDDIRNIMFRTDLYRRMTVNRFMAIPPARVIVGTQMSDVMKTFDKTNAWNLPVVDNDGKYVGFVSKSKIFSSYRQVLKHYSYD